MHSKRSPNASRNAAIASGFHSPRSIIVKLSQSSANVKRAKKVQSSKEQFPD